MTSMGQCNWAVASCKQQVGSIGFSDMCLLGGRSADGLQTSRLRQ